VRVKKNTIIIALLYVVYLVFSLIKIGHIQYAYSENVDIGDALLYIGAYYNDISIGGDLFLVKYYNAIGHNVGYIGLVFHQMLAVTLMVSSVLLVGRELSLISYNVSAVNLSSFFVAQPFIFFYSTDLIKEPFIFFAFCLIYVSLLKFSFCKNGSCRYWGGVSACAGLFILDLFRGGNFVALFGGGAFAVAFFTRFLVFRGKNYFIRLFFVVLVSIMGLLYLLHVVGLSVESFADGDLLDGDYGYLFYKFVYGRSILDSWYYFPFYMIIALLHPLFFIGYSSGLFFIYKLSLLSAVAYYYSGVNKWSSCFDDVKSYKDRYLFVLTLLYSVLLLMPVVWDSAGINLRHKLPGLFFVGILIYLKYIVGLRSEFRLMYFNVSVSLVAVGGLL